MSQPPALPGLLRRLLDRAAGLLARARLRQWWADLRASFWLRPAVMTLFAILLAETLIRVEGSVDLPDWLEAWVYAGAAGGARDVLGVIAGASIAVAGTTFSITVAALTLASNQMGPRLLRNFTRDPGNQYALGALVATFAYSLVALRSVHSEGDGAFVPQLAVSVGLLMAFACAGVLIWFLHHVASSISVDRVIAQVYRDLSDAMGMLAEADEQRDAGDAAPDPEVAGAPLTAPVAGGFLRVLDDASLADWAEAQDALMRLRVQPGRFIFPCSVVGTVWPADAQGAAQVALTGAMGLGDRRSVEQDLEFAVRQLVEIGLRAVSPSIQDPFTAIAVLDRLGAALCQVAGRALPTGRVYRGGRLRLDRPETDYEGLVGAMFHMLRQGAAGEAAVMIRLLEILAEVGAVETDPDRRRVLRAHGDLTRDAALGASSDAAARAAIADRHGWAMAALGTGAADARWQAPVAADRDRGVVPA